MSLAHDKLEEVLTDFDITFSTLMGILLVKKIFTMEEFLTLKKEIIPEVMKKQKEQRDEMDALLKKDKEDMPDIFKDLFKTK